MGTLVLIIIVCLTAAIESQRINYLFGDKENISKFWTFIIGIFFAGLGAAIIQPASEFIYIVQFIFIRGAFYSPFLNLFRGLKIDYTSKTTNSIIDKFEAENGTFWPFRILYLLFYLISVCVEYL